MLHLKEIRYKCEMCSSFCTGNKAELKRHHERVHDPNFEVSGFTCANCGFRAVSRRGLDIHMYLTHSKKKEELQGDDSYDMKEGNGDNTSTDVSKRVLGVRKARMHPPEMISKRFDQSSIMLMTECKEDSTLPDTTFLKHPLVILVRINLQMV